MEITKQNYAEMGVKLLGPNPYKQLARNLGLPPANEPDLYVVEASKIFGVPYSKVTLAQRRQAKAYNLGRHYGMGSRKITNKLKSDV